MTEPFLTIVSNPQNWPDIVLPVFTQTLTCSFATLTRQGRPVTNTLIPYMSDDEKTIDVSTGLTSPTKAERARNNPKVALLFADNVTGQDFAPVVLVYGQATVRDADLQANTDRYVRLSLAKTHAAFSGVPTFLLPLFSWYFARIWIQITPLRILWWPARNTERPPQIWEAPANLEAPPSDPGPQHHIAGGAPTPTEWRPAALHALQALRSPVLTTVNSQGFPSPIQVKNAVLSQEGFRLDVPAGMPALNEGPACLTFHTHPRKFYGQENKSFVGYVSSNNEREAIFTIERLLPDWSFPGSRVEATLHFLNSGRFLAPRLQEEARLRRQPVPKVRLQHTKASKGIP
ncbi:pyridoxamine 5'-phosphate oxidase family protein [Ktedonosporobacter rubrisoli]|uniref:Pyridoxamine 5'-phosphate oxidase family protein n=1 Tax=Ktedonosporobacter rubrisoli TaxID=2509675 RepID=A0A4P6JIE2_KTERU|nr:pyridoxamine 5'-phosphate oxidase family protein [Ktedonosporobacter rubrisoli]QBD74829.1 pyridoxamine 5'-phosphate oxidase family protein [Ktedonosporobacter rubrisoli]